MDRITLLDKGVSFNTRFAAPSILTGYFVAAVLGSTVEEVTEAFTNPGNILVHNVADLYADATYTGYTRINEIRQQLDEIIVILDRGENYGNGNETDSNQ